MVTQLNTITLSENTVIISLERYNELLSKEKDTNSKTIYIKSASGWGSWSSKVVVYDDEVVEAMAKDLKDSNQEEVRLKLKISDLERTIDELVKTDNKSCQKTLNWFQRIFKFK